MSQASHRLTLVVAIAALAMAVLSFGANLVSAGSGLQARTPTKSSEQVADVDTAGGRVLAGRATLPLVVTTTPTVVSFQGRLLSANVPFNGTGFFKFAIVNAAGTTSFWSNDGSSTTGNEPGAAVTLGVSDGLFTVLLGDTSLGNMTQSLSASVFGDADRRLRIWFSTTNSGYVQLGPDERIASVPFALNAQTLDGLDPSAFLQQPAADARYARLSPTTQQIALLKWYTAISSTQADFAAGSAPQAIAFDGADLWVTNVNSNTVSVIRASDGLHMMTPTVGLLPEAIAFDGANLWVANDGSNSVSVVRASDGFHVMTLTVGATPRGTAFDGTNMWVANYNDNTVSVLRASDGFHVMTPTVGAQPQGIAFDGTNMWVANYSDNTVSVLRASDGFHVMTPTAGLHPQAIAFDGANMWVANRSSTNVSVLRASDGFHVMTPTAGTGPIGIAFDGAAMWVTNINSDSVSVLRVNDGSLVKTVRVGSAPYGVAFDGAFMWVANNGSNTVSKR